MNQNVSQRYERLVEQGKVALAAKRYEDAARCFQDAFSNLNVKAPGSQKLAILDLQCSTLVKLKRLGDALDTAKAMIRLDKQNARGYLRAAAIEKIRNDAARALQFLSHGYTRVPKSDMLYANLVAQRTEMQDSVTKLVVTSKATDPMTVLPLELLQDVLKYLGYVEIVSALRVCKAWKRVLSRLRPLTDTVDFRQAHKQITPTALNASVNRLVRPKMVALEKLLPTTAIAMSKRLSMWSRWTSVNTLFLNDSRLSPHSISFEKLDLRFLHLGLDCPIPIERVSEILSTCELLQTATFKRIKSGGLHLVPLRKNLETLELGNAFDLSAFPIIPEWFAAFPNLRTLVVSGAAASQKNSWDLRQNKQLVKLDTYASVIRSIYLPSSLEQWLWDGTEVHFFNVNHLRESPNPLPNLHTVCFSGDNTRDALSFLRKSSVSPDQLHRVGLHNRQNGALMTGDDPNIQLMRGAREFSFESESLADDMSAQFASSYPEIEILQLAAPRITGAFVADVLKRKGNRIRRLVLKDCQNVSPDTIDWARARGVDVFVHRGQVEVRGGRRMREGFFGD